jgi:hypothetical protein
MRIMIPAKASQPAPCVDSFTAVSFRSGSLGPTQTGLGRAQIFRAHHAPHKDAPHHITQVIATPHTEKNRTQ